MQLFLDSAVIDEVIACKSLGFVDGVTTNPTLLAKTKVALPQTIQAICEAINGPVSAECLAIGVDDMLAEAHQLAAIHPHVVVKVPLTAAGLQCVQKLSQAHIKTNVTLCFSLAQGLLAAKAGATYVSPFIGRIEDLGGDGLQLIAQLAQLYRLHGYSTKILAASIRSVRHVVAAGLAGAHAATMPYKIINQLLEHPQTASGIATFLADSRSKAC